MSDENKSLAMNREPRQCRLKKSSPSKDRRPFLRRGGKRSHRDDSSGSSRSSQGSKVPVQQETDSVVLKDVKNKLITERIHWLMISIWKMCPKKPDLFLCQELRTKIFSIVEDNGMDWSKLGNCKFMLGTQMANFIISPSATGMRTRRPLDQVAVVRQGSLHPKGIREMEKSIQSYVNKMSMLSMTTNVKV